MVLLLDWHILFHDNMLLLWAQGSRRLKNRRSESRAWVLLPVLIHHKHLILAHGVVVQVVVLTATHAAHKLNLLEVAALSCRQLIHPILVILCWLSVLVDDVIAAHRARHGRRKLTILTHDLDSVWNLVVNRLLTMRLQDVLSVAYLSIICPSWSHLVRKYHIWVLIITAFFMLDQRFRRFLTILRTSVV